MPLSHSFCLKVFTDNCVFSVTTQPGESSQPRENTQSDTQPGENTESDTQPGENTESGEDANPTEALTLEELSNNAEEDNVSVHLVQTVQLLPIENSYVQVTVDGGHSTCPLLLQCDDSVEETIGILITDTLFQPDSNSRGWVLMANMSGFTQIVEKGLE